MNKIKPKKWTDVYPVGTKEGDEESKFFKSLARSPKYEWKSVAALAKESNLDKKRVEQIILKYYKLGMVFQNPRNEDQWGYWERVTELIPEEKKTIKQIDQNKRINNILKN
jgi:predicted transcriptional regulator